MKREEVLKLAELARIKLSDEEADLMSHDFSGILDYVGQIKEASEAISSPASRQAKSHPLRNVMREDGVGHETGINTEKLLSQAPNREGDYVKVKKIL